MQLVWLVLPESLYRNVEVAAPPSLPAGSSGSSSAGAASAGGPQLQPPALFTWLQLQTSSGSLSLSSSPSLSVSLVADVTWPASDQRQSAERESASESGSCQAGGGRT